MLNQKTLKVKYILVFIFIISVNLQLQAHLQHTQTYGHTNVTVENNYVSQSDEQSKNTNDLIISSQEIPDCTCCFSGICVGQFNKCACPSENSGYPQENCHSEKCHSDQSGNISLINFSNNFQVLFTYVNNSYLHFNSNKLSHKIGSLDNTIQGDLPIYLSIHSLLI